MNIYKRLLKYTPEKKRNAYISILLSIVSVSVNCLAYVVFYETLKSFIIEKNFSNSIYYASIIVGLMIVFSIIYYLAVWTSHTLGFRLETNMRKEGIKHLMQSSFSFYDKNESAKIRKIIDDNAANTHRIVAHLIPDLSSAVLAPILCIIIMFFIDTRLALLIFFMTIIGLFQIKAMVGNKDFMEKYTLAFEKMTSEGVEFIRGIQVLKIFRTSIFQLKNFHKAIHDYSKYALNYAFTCKTPYVSFYTMFNLLIVFPIPFAIYFINSGESAMIILCKLIFFTCFSSVFFMNFARIMYVAMNYFMALQAVDKLESIFEEIKKDKIEYGSISEIENYDIEFKNVSFAYGENKILNNLSFYLQAKKIYALVGSSGSGKTTIAKLISGFYNIDSGEILIGSKNILSYKEESIIKNIAFVFQESKLFHKSILENVRVGNLSASDDECLKALELAKCNDILDKFKMREHTVIGTKGIYLSGGEVQRIAIARAILKNANIIILDEATSSSDAENEYEIQQAIKNLMKNKTVIMIAHRLSSIISSDEILFIENGQIVERGRHSQLINAKGKYRDIQNIYNKANAWRLNNE